VILKVFQRIHCRRFPVRRIVSSAMMPDFMLTDFMPTDSTIRDFMLPVFALSILMRPEIMTRLADPWFGKLITAISFLAIRFSARLPMRCARENRVSAVA